MTLRDNRGASGHRIDDGVLQQLPGVQDMISSQCSLGGIIVLSAAAFWLTENAGASGDTTESSVGSEKRSNPDPRIDALLDEV